MTELHLLDGPIAELARAIATGAVSAESVTREALDRAERGKELNAYLTLASDSALAAARALDLRRARGEKLGKLAGVPIAVKDALCTRDAPTTAGSAILNAAGARRAPGRPRARLSSAVRRHRGRAGSGAPGAVVVGQGQHGRVRDGLVRGKTRRSVPLGTRSIRATHPEARRAGAPSPSPRAWRRQRSVATPVARSGNLPALSGIVGVKPSYGRVSRYGPHRLCLEPRSGGPLRPRRAERRARARSDFG
jgi:aspartyl-tRNA(Asn)/glutamyl-tRNA(Gln) amidotransferase subunit A